MAARRVHWLALLVLGVLALLAAGHAAAVGARPAGGERPQAAGVALSPSHDGQVWAGEQVSYRHAVTNTGTASDTITLAVSSGSGWEVALVGAGIPAGSISAPLQLQAQTAVSFQVSLKVPYGTAGDNELTQITARSKVSATLVVTATDTSRVWGRNWFPLVFMHWPPIPYQPKLAAIAGADDGVYSVSWTESPHRFATDYTLQEATNSAFTAGLRQVCVTTAQSCPVTGKVAGTYYYRVRGRNEWGTSSWSNPVSAVVLLPAVPLLNTIENGDGDDAYSVTWNAAARATGYWLQEATGPWFDNWQTRYQGPLLQWPVSGKPYGAYFYRVAATGPTGQSAWSDTGKVNVPAPLPSMAVLDTHTTYAAGAYRVVVGEVYNNSASFRHSVRVTVRFFNAGTQVGSSSANTLLDTVHPHEKACFAIVLANPAAWSSYAFDPVSSSGGGSARPHLTVTAHAGYAAAAYYRITGQIRNDAGRKVHYAAAVATLYNQSGRALHCDQVYVNSTDLNAEQTSGFDLWTYPPSPAAVTHYVLATSGQ